MELEEALPIVRQLADGLAAAHTAGVIHRDFKSGNVMLVKPQGSETGDAKFRAVITDFGLARHAEPGEFDASLTDSGVVVGTPAYMAPEQFEGKEASSASDIYSFGVVLYDMVTGRTPFDGALLGVAASALEEELGPLAAAETADGAGVSSHGVLRPCAAWAGGSRCAGWASRP